MIVNQIPIGYQYLIQTDTDRWCLIDLLLVVLPWEAYVGEVRVRVRDISHMWERLGLETYHICGRGAVVLLVIV